jgi:hypothetical protein
MLDYGRQVWNKKGREYWGISDGRPERYAPLRAIAMGSKERA